MDFTEYQAAAATTAVYPDRLGPVGLMYAALGTAGEAGEVADKVKKLWRDHGAELTVEIRENIGKEIGDVLWYLAEVASNLHLNLDVIAEQNVEKLRSRQERGVLGGSGDHR